MMDDARRHRFDVLLVWSYDRLARSTKHLLQTIDELNGMGIQFMSQREAIDTEGALGRAIIVIVSAMAELERRIIIECVKAGMRRARLEGRQIGRFAARCKSCAGDYRPTLWNEPYAGRQETRHLTGARLPLDERGKGQFTSPGFAGGCQLRSGITCLKKLMSRACLTTSKPYYSMAPITSARHFAFSMGTCASA